MPSLLTIENIQILNHYGQYGDIVIVRMNRGSYQVVTYIPFYDLNIQFVFGNRNTPLVYKNGVFFELYDAYEKGIITKEIVISLYEKINNDYVIVEDDRQNKFYDTLKSEWFYYNDK